MVTLKDVHLEDSERKLRGQEDSIDERNEQKNTAVKDDGEAVGLTGNPAALRRWMIEASSEKRKK